MSCDLIHDSNNGGLWKLEPYFSLLEMEDESVQGSYGDLLYDKTQYLG